MTSLEGVTDLHMSGARAVFQTKKGRAPDEVRLADAFAEQGMKLESLERVERPRAAARYEVDSGIT